MRCLVFHGAGKPMTVERVDDPEPSDHEIIVKVGRCGICGSDVSMTDTRSAVHFADGARLGHEYAGEVVALGRAVTDFRIGDLVTALPTQGCGHCAHCRAGDPNACAECRYVMGGFGEYTRADARLAIPLPRDLSLTDGALVEPLACGGQAARMAGIVPGARVLVLGVGPIGLASIFAARRAGAGRIAAVARSHRAKNLAEAIGADAFLEGVPTGEEVADRLGGLPDVVFECTGAPGMIGAAIDLVAPRGTVVSAGLCFDAQTIGFGAAIGKQITLRFSLAYTLADFQRAVDALAAGHIEPRAMIGETISLDDVPATIERLRGNRADHKLMVDPWSFPLKDVIAR